MNKPFADKTIGFAGAGRMAQALSAGFVKAGLIPESSIYFFDPDPQAAEKFQNALSTAHRATSNDEMVSSVGIVYLAVKPQYMAKVLDEIQPRITQDHLVVSVAAGIPIAHIQHRLKTDRIVRVMPNTPCLIGEGVSAIAAGSGAKNEDRLLVEKLQSSVGIAMPVSEDQMDAVTGLSGSGPAYVFTMIEALASGGVMMGLSLDVALSLATHTVYGAAALVKQTGQHPSVLRDQVTSPGGTTIHGLQALEAGGVRAGLIEAVRAATIRASELSKLVS